jgi:flagellar biosynthesis GTPase FlhF
MDGELFKTEVAQKLFLLLKSQASESLSPLYNDKSLAEYTRAIETFKSWPQDIRDEELATLESRAGGKEELRQLWTSVSAQWVRLTRKSEHAKASVKIRTPDAADVLKSFFIHLVSKTWCARGELWTMDPLKQDFVFREVFRQAVGESVHILEDSKPEKDEDEARKEAEKARLDQKKQDAEQKKAEQELAEKQLAEKERADLERAEQERAEKELAEQESAREAELQRDATETMEAEKDDDDDIGPDDSVSHFFDSASVMSHKELVAPTRRFADSGTVAYAPSVRRAVQPLKIQLQSPLQHIPE